MSSIGAQIMSRPGILTGAWVGLLLTLPLIIISALGNQLAGLPFVPYDLFPLIRDLTPGAILTLVIDTMVSTIIALDLGRVDEAAKTAEQGMAILMLVGVGVVAGAIFFAVLNALKSRGGALSGLLFGLTVGIPMAIISQSLGLSASTGASALNLLWIVLLFAIWGLLHAWVYNRLSVPETDTTSRALPVN